MSAENFQYPDMDNDDHYVWEPEDDPEDVMTDEERADLHLMQADYYSSDPSTYATKERADSDVFADEEMDDGDFLSFQNRLGLDPSFIRRNRPYREEV